MLKSFNLRRHFQNLPGLLFDIPPAPTDPDKKINIFASGTEVEISRMESKKILVWMSWWTSFHFFFKKKDFEFRNTESNIKPRDTFRFSDLFFPGFQGWKTLCRRIQLCRKGLVVCWTVAIWSLCLNVQGIDNLQHELCFFFILIWSNKNLVQNWSFTKSVFFTTCFCDPKNQRCRFLTGLFGSETASGGLFVTWAKDKSATA